MKAQEDPIRCYSMHIEHHVGRCRMSESVGSRGLAIPEPGHAVASTQGLSLSGSSTVTMGYIWELNEENKCKELVQAVDTYLQIPRDENTTATCRCLQGDGLRRLGEFDRSRILLADVNESPECIGAWWMDQTGTQIPVSQQCRVALRLVAEQDTCPFPRGSHDYTTLAWTYLNKEKLDTAELLAKSCIERFSIVADKQQLAYRRTYGDKWPKRSTNLAKNKRYP